jgi:ankyrin repeat protein
VGEKPVNQRRLWEIGATTLLLVAVAGIVAGFFAWRERQRWLTEQLVTVLQRGDTTRAKSLINQGADVNAMAEGTYSALMMAAGEGDVAWTRLLLQRGAAIEDRERFSGDTALLIAARGHGEVLPWRMGNRRWSGPPLPEWLGQAPPSAYLTITETLLARGANVNARDRGGRTP